MMNDGARAIPPIREGHSSQVRRASPVAIGIAVLAAGVIAAAGCVRPDSSPPAEAEQLAPQEGYVASADSVRLLYRMVGSGPDTVIVLHGGPGFTMAYLYADLEPLATVHTLLFYDQRGAGGSSLLADSTAFGGDRYAADLEAIRRHFGMERVTLLAHSWGAGVAALYAQRHPDRIERMLIVGAMPLRRSVLLDAFERMNAGRDSLTRSRMAEWEAAREADPGDASACREFYTLWFEAFVADTAALRRSKGDFCAGTPESLRNALKIANPYTWTSMGDWDWRSSLGHVSAPTLVIHGTVDPLPLAGAREWIRALPNARILELDRIGHFPYLEAPEVFVDAVNRFLGGEWPDEARVVR